MTEPRTVDDQELRQRLTPEQYAITREGATEPAFTGVHWDNKEPGVYRCVVCGTELFRSDEKYESGTGWPSFWAPTEEGNVVTEEDRSYGMVRIEVKCAVCHSHLGHVFPDGPQPTGLRYCMNSGALDFDPAGD